uniref:Orfan n=1 Tax=Strongyloides stercoralis TaxID=6248 RepID=A0A0K0EDA1_STRER
MNTSISSTTSINSTYYVTTTETLIEHSYNIKEYFPIILLSFILILLLCACICGEKSNDIANNNFTNYEMTNNVETYINESVIDDDGDVIVFDRNTNPSKTLN